ncbi:MAG: nucleoside 2-deoxyribosyltransferase domain-containing protein [Chloracidobacterium sp.]|nr:nucleoside 2-deoxyribosyltransferase domain-containing protein [Chloracidobacterium sp.]
MLCVQSPENVDLTSPAMRVFLAGSIDSGMADDWQTLIVDRLRDLDVIVFNPRRTEWTAATSPKSEELRRQINWELDAIERSDLIAFYFAPGTKAPISLLELGLIAPRKRAIVCCQHGFWRKTNVDVICERFEIQQVSSFEDLVNEIKESARQFKRT